MLPNTDSFICQTDCASIGPISEHIPLNSAPYDIGRLTSKEFLVCDSNTADNSTQIMSVSITGEKTEMLTLQGTY
jgi:hypothetical protein